MTADLSGGEFKSHSSKFADGASKACEIQRYSRQKTAQQRVKNNKHCILRRTASENTKCLLGTPQAPKRPHSGQENRLTPKYKQRRHHYENREKEAWKTAQTQGYGV